MKKLLNTHNFILAMFYTVYDIMPSSFINSVLLIIDSYKSIFGIKGYSHSMSPRPRYVEIDYDKIVNKIWKPDNYGSMPYIRFGGYKPQSFSLDILPGSGNIFSNRYDWTSLSIEINSDFLFHNFQQKLNNSIYKDFLDLCVKVTTISHPLCGYIHHCYDSSAISVAISEYGTFSLDGITKSVQYGTLNQPDIDCPLAGIFWCNYFGPKCRSFFNKKLHENAPGVYLTQELPNSSIMIYTAPHPFTPDHPEHRHNQLSLWKHLGLTPVPNLEVLKLFKKSHYGIYSK